MTWVQALRVATFALGAFSIGFALYIGYLYGKGVFHSGIYRRGWHVAAIIVAWIMMITEEMVEIGEHWDDPTTNWHLPYFTVAISLGTFALYQLVRVRAAADH